MQSPCLGLLSVVNITSNVNLFNSHCKQFKTLFTFVNHVSTSEHHPNSSTASTYFARRLLITTANPYSIWFKVDVMSDTPTWLCLAGLVLHHYVVVPTMAFINSFLG